MSGMCLIITHASNCITLLHINSLKWRLYQENCMFVTVNTYKAIQIIKLQEHCHCLSTCLNCLFSDLVLVFTDKKTGLVLHTVSLRWL